MDILDDPGTDFRWDVARACPHATFYHTPLWHRVAANASVFHRDRAFGAVLDNGTRVVVPLLERRQKVLGTFVSTFAGCYGGLIADGPVPPDDAEAVIRHVLDRKGKTFTFVTNPLADDAAMPDLDHADIEDDFTHVLTLDRDLDTIVSDYSRGHRSSLKKGRREGVTVRRATTIEEYRLYFEAYQASLERWGQSPSDGYDWSLFEALHALAQEYPDIVTLWLARVDANVASGALLFSWNDHVSYWHGAAHEEYFDHRPNNVLHTDIIDAAIAEGYRYYDFNPSGGYSGVERFKSRFGAETWPIRRVTYTRSMREAVFGS